MTTTVLDRVPVDEISERAAGLRPGRTVLRLLLGVLTLAGWVAAKVFMAFWKGFTHAWAAVAVGWEAAHGPSRARQIATLAARVEWLSAENRRLGGSG